MPDVVRFRVGTAEVRAVVPEVNGVALPEAVSAFEAGRGYTPAGGYGGLIPDHFDFGDLSAYLLGRGNRQWPGRGRLWLLGCECGEVGCWPLEARVDAGTDLVVWTDFRQPHRPDRDYTGFGPFVFDREQYDQAVGAAVRALEPTA